LKKEKQEESIDFQRRRLQALLAIKDALADLVFEWCYRRTRSPQL
jgi:hypothetical protein